MNPSSLQQWIDEFQATSRQQWILGLVTVVAPIGALSAAAVEVGAAWPFGLVVVTVFAVASAIRPDSHTALAVIGVVIAHWLVAVDRLDSPWLPVAGVCLLVYHVVNALAATIPTGGEVPIATITLWCGRALFAAGVVVGIWALVVVLDRRETAGNGLLTGLALAIVAGTAVLIRSRSVEDSR